MPIKLIQQPTVVEAAGNIPKRIEEFIGAVNSETTALSIGKSWGSLLSATNFRTACS